MGRRRRAPPLLFRKAGGGQSGDEARVDLAEVDAQPPALLGGVLDVDESAADRVRHLLERGNRMRGLKDGWATPRQAEVLPGGPRDPAQRLRRQAGGQPIVAIKQAPLSLIEGQRELAIAREQLRELDRGGDRRRR